MRPTRSDLVIYRDTNGDGVADEKKLWFAGGPRGGNLEHQPSGLVWALDNWIYPLTTTTRLRWNGDGVHSRKDRASNGGQWGLAQDDYGKMWWSNAGGEKGLWNFQTPIIYGAIDAPASSSRRNSMEVWPLVGLADVQGGPIRLRVPRQDAESFHRLLRQEVYRGDRLPADLRGDVLLAEPVGRLIRRATVEVKDGITTMLESVWSQRIHPSARIRTSAWST